MQQPRERDMSALRSRLLYALANSALFVGDVLSGLRARNESHSSVRPAPSMSGVTRPLASSDIRSRFAGQCSDVARSPGAQGPQGPRVNPSGLRDTQAWLRQLRAKLDPHPPSADDTPTSFHPRAGTHPQPRRKQGPTSSSVRNDS